MDRLAFNAAAAITEQRISRQMTANELANVSTVGFKRSFEAATQAIKVSGSGMATRYQPQAISKDQIDLTPGTMMATGRNLDIALNGASVLGVSTTQGEMAFTRRGDLHVSPSGVLETGNQVPVRGESGGVINIPAGYDVSISPDGNVYARAPGQQSNAPAVLVDRLVLREASQTPLERRTDGLYQVVGKPGTDIAAPSTGVLPSVTPKALEGSNVNAMSVMVKLMEQSRSFEHQIKVIKETKSGDESGATMLKLS